MFKAAQERFFAMELKNWSIGMGTLVVIDRLLQSMVASTMEVKDAYLLILAIGASGTGAIAGRALHAKLKGNGSVTNGNGSAPEGA